MKKYHIILEFTVIFLLLNLSGCGLFSTRNPEQPDINDVTFQTPTSPDIVVDNFIYSINEKNPDHYLYCFTAGNQTLATVNYIFTPSAEAYTRYYSIFESWDVNSERQSFIALTSKLPTDIFPSLKPPYNLDYVIISQDSTVIKMDYTLNLNYLLPLLDMEYTGSLQFTIKPNPNGLWSITRWVDIKQASDTTIHSWSILKAMLVN